MINVCYLFDLISIIKMHGPMLDRFIDDFSQRQVVDFIRFFFLTLQKYIFLFLSYAIL